MDPTQPVYFDADDARAPFFDGYFQHTQSPKDFNAAGKRWEEIKAIPHRINANDI